uniref:Protein kinase domain-containing protein n=1 Tax=Rhizophagus irregularis (strain DAOM 181602 / DAOM 197198 / MUCL 43194) TaxID=747089 RepID=U9UBQ0_RHIID
MTVYSAIWKDGPLYFNCNNLKYTRDSCKGGFATIYLATWNDKKVALKCLDNLQNSNIELTNEARAYSTARSIDDSNILKIYGISQNPNTEEYVIVLHYANGGDFNNWISVNENFKYFSWEKKLGTLYFIACGLKKIHEKQMVHHDFHTGNILFNISSMEEYGNRIYISDMGLCRKVDDINQNNIYGVMPYVAPEVLRGCTYTQVADIYSFGMIMYFALTGRQPFDDRAHDHLLALDICNGIRPKLNETGTPEGYIDLMKKCWNSNPENRPNVIELNLSLFCITINNLEIKKAENYRNLHLSSLMENRQTTTHPQAIYTSRLLNPFTKDLPKYDNNSECLDCAILD